jgi:hypothetical protein
LQNGNPPNDFASLEIRADVGGFPSGDPVPLRKAKYVSLDHILGSESSTWVNFDFPDLTVTPGITYWIVIVLGPWQNSNNHNDFALSRLDIYPRGNLLYYTGSQWIPLSNWEDMVFITNYPYDTPTGEISVNYLWKIESQMGVTPTFQPVDEFMISYWTDNIYGPHNIAVANQDIFMPYAATYAHRTFGAFVNSVEKAMCFFDDLSPYPYLTTVNMIYFGDDLIMANKINNLALLFNVPFQIYSTIADSEGTLTPVSSLPLQQIHTNSAVTVIHSDDNSNLPDYQQYWKIAPIYCAMRQTMLITVSGDTIGEIDDSIDAELYTSIFPHVDTTIFEDGFEDGTLNKWTYIEYVTASTNNPYQGLYSAFFDATSSEASKLEKEINLDGLIQIDFYLYIASSGRFLFWAAKDFWQQTQSCLEFKDTGELYAKEHENGADVQFLGTFNFDSWMKVSVDINYWKETYDVYIDDYKRGEAIPFYYSSSSSSYFISKSYPGYQCYVDDVQVTQSDPVVNLDYMIISSHWELLPYRDTTTYPYEAADYIYADLDPQHAYDSPDMAVGRINTYSVPTSVLMMNRGPFYDNEKMIEAWKAINARNYFPSSANPNAGDAIKALYGVNNVYDWNNEDDAKGGEVGHFKQELINQMRMSEFIHLQAHAAPNSIGITPVWLKGSEILSGGTYAPSFWIVNGCNTGVFGGSGSLIEGVTRSGAVNYIGSTCSLYYNRVERLVNYLNSGYSIGTSMKLSILDEIGQTLLSYCYLIGDPMVNYGPDIDDDGDGLSNKDENGIGTNPSAPDHDGDWLPDGMEVLLYRTDPLNSDTDGDFRYDGQEFDTDYDGITDGSENHYYLTDPLYWDTDDDYLNDYDDVFSGADPFDKDRDDDGLWDREEVYNNLALFRSGGRNPAPAGNIFVRGIDRHMETYSCKFDVPFEYWIDFKRIICFN